MFFYLFWSFFKEYFVTNVLDGTEHSITWKNLYVAYFTEANFVNQSMAAVSRRDVISCHFPVATTYEFSVVKSFYWLGIYHAMVNFR